MQTICECALVPFSGAHFAGNAKADGTKIYFKSSRPEIKCTINNFGSSKVTWDEHFFVKF